MTQIYAYDAGGSKVAVVMTDNPGRDIPAGASYFPKVEADFPDRTARDRWRIAGDGSLSLAPMVVTEAMVRDEGARRLAVIASAYRPEERETWHKQLAEAKAYSLDALVVTPFLSAMAAGSGETRAQIVTRILANDLAFSIASGTVIGSQRALIEMDPIPEDYATNESYWS